MPVVWGPAEIGGCACSVSSDSKGLVISAGSGRLGRSRKRLKRTDGSLELAAFLQVEPSQLPTSLLVLLKAHEGAARDEAGDHREGDNVTTNAHRERSRSPAEQSRIEELFVNPSIVLDEVQAASSSHNDDGGTQRARERRAPDRYVPPSTIRDQSTDDHKRKQLGGGCNQPSCKRIREAHESIKRKLQDQAGEIRELARQLDDIGSGLSEDAKTALSFLQQALLELMEEDEAEEIEENDPPAAWPNIRISYEAAPSVASSPPPLLLSLRVAVSTVSTSHIDGELAFSQEHLQWTPDANGDAYELGTGASCSWPLSEFKGAVVATQPRTSPFKPPTTYLSFERRDNRSEGERFILRAGNSGLMDANTFVQLFNTTVASTSTMATSTTGATAPTPVGHLVSAPAERRLSKRIQAGRLLRDQLLEVTRLRHSGKMKEAESRLAELLPDECGAVAESREDALARQRVRELRDVAFSFGGLSLSRRVIARFLGMPEVKLLLPEWVQKEQRNTADAETSKLLLDTAKTFLSQLFAARCAPGKQRAGRLSDEDRNARAAALSALLPASLFENRRGRAAMRILGISYRQAKFGSALRQSLDGDTAPGWKRLKTSEHCDKVNTPRTHTCMDHGSRIRSWS